MDYAFAKRYEGVEGSAIRAIFSLLADPQIISFAGGNPSPTTFPGEELARIAGELIARQGASILQYGGTMGTAALTEQVRGLFAAEGTVPQEGELIMLTGSSQGIDLMTKAMIDPGDTVLVEDPTFLGALQTFKLFQANLVGVRMDENGLDPNDLEDKLKAHRAKFLYTIPTFQNPTGRTLPAERRKAVARLCAKYGCMVLEDDPYAALRYEGEPQPSIKSFDTENIVVKLLSFSKTISPGLRVGAAYGPREVIHKFNLGKQGQDVHTANLNQAMVARYIESGVYPAHIRDNCAQYAGKLAAMFEAAERFFPEGTQLVRPQGGMFMWAALPERFNATQLFKTAVENKVAYVPGTHFYAGGGHHNTLRLNFTMASEERILRGMETLGALLR